MIGKLLLIGLIGFIISYIFQLLLLFDINKRVYNHRPGPCRIVNGIEHGSEDIDLITSEGLAFISSGTRYMVDRAPYVKGKIFIYDFNNKNVTESREVKVKGIDLDQFHPHGISSNVLDGRIRLFVINHDKQFKHSIIVFDYNKKENTLEHVKTIKDEKFIRPNDIIALNDDAFIVANDGIGQSSFWNTIEILLQLSKGSVVYYDGKTSSYLLEDSMSPNGITVNKEKTHLFVAHVNGEYIGIYKLDKDFKSVSLISRVDLLTAADNLNIDEEGVIWTGAHPVMKDILPTLSNMDDHAKYAPSQVLRIEFSSDYKSWEITEVYTDDGRQLSGSSVAIYYNNRILIGTVFRQLLHCYISHDEVIRRIE